MMINWDSNHGEESPEIIQSIREMQKNVNPLVQLFFTDREILEQ